MCELRKGGRDLPIDRMNFGWHSCRILFFVSLKDPEWQLSNNASCQSADVVSRI
jgi:hypothetical protein